MSAAKGGVLRYTVVVRHPETGVATALLAGEPVPDWAGGLVSADDLERSEPDKPAKKAAPSKPEK